MTPSAARECRLFIREMEVPLSRPDVGSAAREREEKRREEKRREEKRREEKRREEDSREVK